MKVISSMVTFVKNSDDGERLLSDEGDLEVSNQPLADLGIKMRLQDYVAFSGVPQKANSWPWYWGGTLKQINSHFGEGPCALC